MVISPPGSRASLGSAHVVIERRALPHQLPQVGTVRPDLLSEAGIADMVPPRAARRATGRRRVGWWPVRQMRVTDSNRSR